jgi:hypothetical protein
MRCAEKVAAAYRMGHRDAIAAAREAVAALPEYSLRDTCASAIDALREER